MWVAMVDYSIRILTLSVILSVLVAAMLFVGLQRMIVRPLRRITAGAGGVPQPARGRAPRTASRARAGRDRRGRAGARPRCAAACARRSRRRRRLAALGAGDEPDRPRPAQHPGDRGPDLGPPRGSADPAVRRVAPRLVETLDRAVRLCGETLSYARSGPPAPEPRRVGSGRAGRRRCATRWTAPAGRCRLASSRCRRDLAVLGRSRPAVPRAVQPRPERGRGDAARRAATLRIAAELAPEQLTIDVADTGPGIPEQVRGRACSSRSPARPRRTATGSASPSAAS